MTISAETRTAVRIAFNYRCGYYGTAEADIGGELEIDHFQPTVHGGTDEQENLVYACTTCNRFKSSYWPDPTR
jgi:5-methylcytosine-specific restriction endonuclease McrA